MKKWFPVSKFKFVVLALMLIFGLIFGCNNVGTKQAQNPAHPEESVQYAKRNIAEEAIAYDTHIKQIFDNRCIACHACIESPCQLNLQSYEGAMRGAHKNNVYGRLRKRDGNPQRLFEDKESTMGAMMWRSEGFFDIVGGYNEKLQETNSVLLDYLAKPSAKGKRIRPEKTVGESKQCLKESEGTHLIAGKKSDLSMPYGLPRLANQDIQTLERWVKDGAKRSLNENLEEELFMPKESDKEIIKKWEAYLNSDSLKQKIVSRYLYEHLFLADLYLTENFSADNRPDFYKLVRSKTKCQEKIDMIATATPNSDPGVSEWYYCLKKNIATIAIKNHLQYPFHERQFRWIQNNFTSEPWTATSFPSFSKALTSNPFIVYKELPVKMRYRFLLRDAHYHVATFIKGPVCNGTTAVGVVQDQFYTFFFDPETDPMVTNAEYRSIIEKQVVMPGAFELDDQRRNFKSDYSKMSSARIAFEKTRQEVLAKQFPTGLTLNQIWDGHGVNMPEEGVNDHALLTVLRHSDNIKVEKGAFGDTSKTVFLLDYAVFERIVYNLVVDFDVFGSAKHQVLTRLYMDLIRYDAENNFLQFLPENYRVKLKSSWYQGGYLTRKILANQKEFDINTVKTAVPYSKPKHQYDEPNYKLEFFQKLFFERMKDITAMHPDPINWKELNPAVHKTVSGQDKIISELASVRAPYVQFFPENSVLFIEDESGSIKMKYHIVHIRQRSNIAILFQDNHAPDEDTLAISRVYKGSYFNRFFRVKESELKNFIDDVSIIDTKPEFNKLIKKYGVDRMDPNFWSYYDHLNRDVFANRPIEAGYFDLSRYDM